MDDIRKASLATMAATIIGWDLGHNYTTIRWSVKPKETPKKRAKVKAARKQRNRK